MNRRKAIFSIFLVGSGAAAAYSGYKWYRMNHTPDIAFLDNNKALIADLAETIIPATTTPGAKAAKVHEFIIVMIKDCSDRKTQNSFIDGLKDVVDYTSSNYNKAFTQLTTQQQQEVIKYFQQKGKNYTGILGKVKNKFLSKSFFTILKEYTAIGYCTSKPGATQGLAYDFIPGKYVASFKMIAGQKAWATK
jgi:hypothetical protein